jgi:rhodanese-related sulfurtransferase
MSMEIEREEVCRMVEDGAQLVEVLPREEYEAEHLPGALNIPLQQLDRQTTAPLQQDQPVIVYCYDSVRRESGM